MKRVLAVVGAMLGCAAADCVVAKAQWTLQESHTTASLRGIHSVDGKVAWASGSGGTVLRTVDGGKNWQACAVPPGGEKLDFRGVQAFDAQTAIVMSSGKGDLSRLYKTTDGCGTWKLVAENAESEGFWDAISANGTTHATVLGDSVKGVVQLCTWDEGSAIECNGERASEKEGSFAASNSVLQVSDFKQIDPVWKSEVWWASQDDAHIYFHVRRSEQTPTCEPCRGELSKLTWNKPRAGSSSGVFSFLFRDDLVGVAVGGDYESPNSLDHPATYTGYTKDGGLSWKTPQTFPSGYRSAVAYDVNAKTWISVGPNGTDSSSDDGRNWRPLKPKKGAPIDADKNWNALSPPFVVGSKGRIGVLRADAFGAKAK